MNQHELVACWKWQEKLFSCDWDFSSEFSLTKAHGEDFHAHMVLVGIIICLAAEHTAVALLIVVNA